MTKHEQLISKIQTLKNFPELKETSQANFSPAELELILDALETIQVLEIIFVARARKKNQQTHE